MPTLTFDVLLHGKVIDTTFYSTNRKATRTELEAEQYRSLVDHDGYDAEIRCRLMTRLTRDDFDVEGNYGQGWEIVTSASTMKEARQHLKEYQQNEGGSYRIMRRRPSIFD